MSGNTGPLLSVGIIFKNEIRCLERCLTSFAPLRERAPIEIVAVDTGATDGSRAVAERYADVVADFPWIDDFAAARNAVLDRCTGEWCLTVDADEWLDADVSELDAFLHMDSGKLPNKGMVVIRNYQTKALDDNYGDFAAARLLRMSAAPRYEGAIHELPAFPGEGIGGRAFMLGKTILHHDGYVEFDSEKGKAKRDRNLALIRARLDKDPDDIVAMLHYLNSGGEETDFVPRLRHAVALVKKKANYWQTMGPPLLRQAVLAACERRLPEAEEWLALDRALFPDSIFTRIDVNYAMALRAASAGDHAEALRRGEEYFKACAALKTDERMQLEMAFSVLVYDNAACRRTMELTLANANALLERPARAAALLDGLDKTALDGGQTASALRVLREERVRGGWDTAGQVTALWEEISRPEPDEERARERKAAFLAAGAAIFAEEPPVEPEREPWRLFLPLEGKCALGDAAAMLEAEAPERLTALLLRQESPADLPARALAHALKHGLRLPLPGRALDVEEVDALTAALAGEKETLYALTAEAAGADLEDRQVLLWARGLALAALRVFDWKRPEDENADGMEILRAFAAAERAWLPRCYTDAAIADGHVLPPIHRFGRDCIRALSALDAGEFLASVRALRAGLDTCKDMKPAVEFLLREVQRREAEHARENAPPELRALAEKVRAVLASYPPDDPAVAELKQSEAYQRVAYLIEK